MTDQLNTQSSVSLSSPRIDVHQLNFRYRTLDDEPGENREQSATSSLTQSPNEEYAIQDISFSLPAGELLLIAGPSGCGKSTLLKCLNGLIPNSYPGTLEGEIYLNGRSIKGLALRDLAQDIGTMLQDPDKQIIGSNVEQEIAFGLENIETPRTEMRQRIQAVIKRLHLEKYQRQEIQALSGGQRQQVAAAGILVMRPSIFLFDEPFANLDARAIDELEELINDLRTEGSTIIIVEHRVEEALHLQPNKVLLMKEGRQIFFGNIPDFLKIADPTQVKLPIEVALQRTGETEQILTALTSPIITGQNNSTSSADSILTFEHVYYRYSTFSAEILHDVSFQVHKGETIALLGPNGSGKTTLVKQALGLLRPTRGTVQLYGQNTKKMSVAQIAASVGYVFQSPTAMLFAPTVRKEVSFGPENLKFDPQSLQTNVIQAEEAMNIAQFDQRSPFSLSFGQQKRVAIASVLAMQSRILLLDEPTAGQDYRSYTAFMEYLRSLPELDALLFITHDLDLALRFTRRILLLKEGNLVADGEPLNVLADSDLLATCNLRPTSLLHYLLAHQNAVK